jgi:hypothetical protein
MEDLTTAQKGRGLDVMGFAAPSYRELLGFSSALRWDEGHRRENTLVRQTRFLQEMYSSPSMA